MQAARTMMQAGAVWCGRQRGRSSQQRDRSWRPTLADMTTTAARRAASPSSPSSAATRSLDDGMHVLGLRAS